MKLKIILNILILLLSAAITFGQVTVTPSSGGTELVRSTAQDGHLNVYTTLGDITIAETLDDDFKQSQSNATLILTAPTNWVFEAGVGSINYSAGNDITAHSLNVTATTITYTFTVANGNAGMDSFDTVAISGIRVQAETFTIPDSVSILRSSANAGSGTITGITNDITNFGYLSLDPDSPMPVELVSFTADVYRSNVILNWSTATEVNNYGFEVQRSVVDNEWEVIGFVEGHGNSNSPKDYEYIDDLSTLPEYHQFEEVAYRLKQIDTDGTFEYYGLSASADLSTVTDIHDDAFPVSFELYQNYPNPFNPSSTIKFGLPVAGNTLLEVYNSLGQKVATLIDREMSAGYHEVVWNASEFTSGIYLYKITAENFTDIKKMMLVK